MNMPTSNPEQTPEETSGAEAVRADAPQSEKQLPKAREVPVHQEDKARQEALRQEEKLRREALEQEDKARREALKMEQRIAQDHQRGERERLKSEEHAQTKTVRRVGTMTMGLALIAIGGAILWYMIDPTFNVEIVAWLAPIILIGLGIEILIRYFFSKDRTYKYDFASGVICVFLVFGSISVAAVPQLMYYIGPERQQTENRAQQALEEKVYTALQGNQDIDTVSVRVYVEPRFDGAKEAGSRGYDTVYQSVDIAYLTPYKTPQEFATQCRAILDRFQEAGIQPDSVDFRTRGEESAMALSIDNRLHQGMDAQHLAQRVRVEKTELPIEERSRELRDRYQTIEEGHGEAKAERYLELLDLYGTETAEAYCQGLSDPKEPTQDEGSEAAVPEGATESTAPGNPAESTAPTA